MPKTQTTDLENRIYLHSIGLLRILLIDRTTNQNIIWATNDYSSLGESYQSHSKIDEELLISNQSTLIQPRMIKARNDQRNRTRERAEVFTPTWLCNEQNNLIDEAWFGKKNVFNKPNKHSWSANENRISFDNIQRSWHDYVDARRMEMACGEAPYLVSRYDAVTGKRIAINKRIGMLDRKIRVISENTNSEDEWFFWVKRAYQSIYGYELQGDNVLLSRENLLLTFIENTEYSFNHYPSITQLSEIITVISWNLWQMDGLTSAVPFDEVSRTESQPPLFSTDVSVNNNRARYCKIMDWRTNKVIEVRSLMTGEIR